MVLCLMFVYFIFLLHPLCIVCYSFLSDRSLIRDKITYSESESVFTNCYSIIFEVRIMI
jgi:hypothetical protein